MQFGVSRCTLKMFLMPRFSKRYSTVFIHCQIYFIVLQLPSLFYISFVCVCVWGGGGGDKTPTYCEKQISRAEKAENVLIIKCQKVPHGLVSPRPKSLYVINDPIFLVDVRFSWYCLLPSQETHLFRQLLSVSFPIWYRWYDNDMINDFFKMKFVQVSILKIPNVFYVVHPWKVQAAPKRILEFSLSYGPIITEKNRKNQIRIFLIKTWKTVRMFFYGEHHREPL